MLELGADPPGGRPDRRTEAGRQIIDVNSEDLRGGGKLTREALDFIQRLLDLLEEDSDMPALWLRETMTIPETFRHRL